MLGVILAAGAGERLRPLTSMRPKAVIPTLDVPALHWHVARMKAAGASQVYVNSYHRTSVVTRTAEDASDRAGIPVTVVVEPMPLGTAGALKNLSEVLTEPFFLSNSDVVTDVPLDLLHEAHVSGSGLATLLAVPTDGGADLVVEEGWVTELIRRNEEDSPGWIYGGAAVLEPEAIALIPEGVSGLFETVMTRALAEARGLAAVGWEGYWKDIGTPANYLAANMDALSGHVAPPIQTSGGIVDTCYVGKGASVDLATIRHSVIGEGAAVSPGADMARCVVWDRTQVPHGLYRDMIIGDGCQLQIARP